MDRKTRNTQWLRLKMTVESCCNGFVAQLAPPLPSPRYCTECIQYSNQEWGLEPDIPNVDRYPNPLYYSTTVVLRAKLQLRKLYISNSRLHIRATRMEKRGGKRKAEHSPSNRSLIVQKKMREREEMQPSNSKILGSMRGKLTWSPSQGWGSESGSGERLQSLGYLIRYLTRDL